MLSKCFNKIRTIYSYQLFKLFMKLSAVSKVPRSIKF